MPKRNLDYDLSLHKNKKKSKPKPEPEEDDEEGEEMEHPMMDMFGMTDSVTVRDNDIYFYCSVNKKNIVM